MLRELVEHVVKQIVDNPDKVEVRQIKSEGTVILEISTAKEDLGKIIGKEGRGGKKAVVEILEK